MQWQKRGYLFVVVTLLLIPAVVAQWFDGLSLNFVVLLESLERWHIIGFFVYFTIFFGIIKKSLEKIWGDKDLEVKERDERLINGLSFVVAIGLASSLVVWSYRNNFTFFNFGPIAALFLAGAFVVSFVVWRFAKDKESRVWLPYLLLVLFVILLALKFFSPQMFGIDLLGAIPFSDYLVYGVLGLIVFGILYNLVKGRSGAGGATPAEGGGGVVGFFSGGWGKMLGFLLLGVLVLVVLYYAGPFLLALVSGLSLWWLLLLIIPVAIGLFLLLRWLWGKVGGVLPHKEGEEAGSGDFSVKAHVAPSNQIMQGESFRLYVTVDPPSGNFVYRWFDDQNMELGPNKRRENTRVVSSLVEMPRLPSGVKDERSWFARVFRKSPYAVEKVYRVEVRDMETKKAHDAKVKVTILPAREKLAYLAIVAPARSGETVRMSAGAEGELVFDYKLKDAFRQVHMIKWSIGKGKNALEDGQVEIGVQSPPEEGEEESVFSIRKEPILSGEYTIFVRGHDEHGKPIAGFRDYVFLVVEATPVGQLVRIVGVDGTGVSRVDSEAHPVQFTMGKPRIVEAVLTKKDRRANNIMWLVMPPDPAKILEYLEDEKAYVQVGVGPRTPVILEKDEYDPGTQWLLVAMPAVAVMAPGKRGVKTNIMPEGYDYLHIVAHHESKVKIELNHWPFTFKSKEKPYAGIELGKEIEIGFGLDDPDGEVASVRFWMRDADGKEDVLDAVAVSDRMRGTSNKRMIRFDKPWSGTALVWVEALTKKDMPLARDECWIELKQEAVTVIIEEVRGSVLGGNGFELVKMPKGVKKHTVLDYGAEVVFIVLPNHPELIGEYQWTMHESEESIIQNERTREPKIMMILAKNSFPGGPYELRVYARAKDGSFLLDPVTKRGVGDRLWITFRENTITPYVRVAGHEVRKESEGQVKLPLGKVVIEGLVLEQSVEVDVEWEVKDPKGQVVREVYRAGKQGISINLEEVGVYTVKFGVFAPELKKGAELVVKIDAVVVDVAEENIIEESADVDVRSELERLWNDAIIINTAIGNAHRFLVKDAQARKKMQSVLDAAEFEIVENLIATVNAAQLKREDTQLLGSYVQLTDPKKLKGGKVRMADVEKKKLVAALRSLRESFRVLKKLEEHLRWVEIILAQNKIPRREVKQRVAEGLQLLNTLLGAKHPEDWFG